jgi:hypothetical protein
MKAIPNTMQAAATPKMTIKFTARGNMAKRMVAKITDWILDIGIGILPKRIVPWRLWAWYEQRVLLQMGVLEKCCGGCGETHITDAYFANPSAYQTHTLRDKVLPDVPLWIQELARGSWAVSSDLPNQSRRSETLSA